MRLENNTAEVNWNARKFKFKFKDEKFTIDLSEGDAEDNWNAIQTKDGEVFDVNLFIEDQTDHVDEDFNYVPSSDNADFHVAFAVYPLTKEGDDSVIDYSKDHTSIKIVKQKGTIKKYLELF